MKYFSISLILFLTAIIIFLVNINKDCSMKCKTYQEALLECSELKSISKRNDCRARITNYYIKRYDKDNEILFPDV